MAGLSVLATESQHYERKQNAIKAHFGLVCNIMLAENITCEL